MDYVTWIARKENLHGGRWEDAVGGGEFTVFIDTSY